MVLQEEIGKNFYVVEEGLCGRYTVHDEPYRIGRNGAALLQPILETHAPVYLLILFLGTNDVLHHVDLTAFDTSRGIEVLVKIAESSETGAAEKGPKILLISPPRIRKLSEELLQQCHGDPTKSKGFSKLFRELAKSRKLFFLDAAKIVEPSPVDGVHLDEEGQLLLGKAIGAKVLNIFRGET